VTTLLSQQGIDPSLIDFIEFREYAAQEQRQMIMAAVAQQYTLPNAPMRAGKTCSFKIKINKSTPILAKN
jgi:hypothetical protein